MMSRSLDVRRSIALTAAFVAATWGAAALPAAADHADAGNGKGKALGHAKHESRSENGDQGRDRADDARSEHKDDHKDDHKDKSSNGNHGADDAEPPGAEAGSDSEQGSTGGADGADPLGNNGTVKIESYGDIDGIPENTPHPGCEFQVEWYGFDEGADIISSVSFDLQAPTTDVALSGTSPSEVFVGGDPATGAGTDTGLDGVQTYTLSFDGPAHDLQGYHVMLTVATPSSLGNDTKTKVFWVEPCESETTAAGAVAGEGATDDTQVLGIQATAPGNADTTGVLGIQATAANAAPGVAAADGNADEVAVPTAVDAGGEENAFLELIGSAWGWALIVTGLGAALVAGAFATRRASVRAHD